MIQPALKGPDHTTRAVAERAQFAQSGKLEKAIKANLKRLGYGG